MNADRCDYRQLQSVLLLLLVLCFCLYLPTLFHPAFADDDIYLTYSNRFLREASWADLYQLLLKPTNAWEYLPLRDFSYWLDFHIFGDETIVLHASNLIWYAGSCSAFFWLFRELIAFCRQESVVPDNVLALCGLLLFIAHPAHVEVVAWIASRKDLIAATLGFISLAVLVRALRHHWRWQGILLAALSFFAACFGKASAVTGVLLSTLLTGVGWRLSPQINPGRKACFVLLFWGLCAVALAIHFEVARSTGIRIVNAPGAWLMFDRASRILATLIGIICFPYPLRFYYDVYLLGSWHWLVSAGASLLLLAALRDLTLRRSLWAFGVVFLFSPLLVYLQLAPFTTWSLASERFVFAAVAGWALMLADLLSRIARPPVIVGFLLAIILPCFLLVSARVADWGHTQTLLSREYEMQPRFHNAIRDQIVFKLLPEKRYVDAAMLARQVPRSYAADALLALIDTEQAYRRMSDARSELSADDSSAIKQGFCRAANVLASAVQSAYARMPDERDVSYNNILRTFEWKLKYRYGDANTICRDLDLQSRG